MILTCSGASDFGSRVPRMISPLGVSHGMTSRTADELILTCMFEGMLEALMKLRAMKWRRPWDVSSKIIFPA